jgi:predicted RNase H-like HicB family nuclease
MAYCISVTKDETGDGTARVYGPYHEEGIAKSDWSRMGCPDYGVLPLRAPPGDDWITHVFEHEFDRERGQLQFSVFVRAADDGGYWTEVTGLPGAGSQGETVDEAIRNTRESITEVMRSMRERGEEIPSLRASDRFVTLKFRAP